MASSGAIISDCGRYRYTLTRDGPGSGCTAVVMVNPSTADATKDDPTIRKMRGFGARNGWGQITVVNLFAYRATDVRELSHVCDPIGPENDDYLRAVFAASDRVIAAWGPLAKQPAEWRARRWLDVLCMARPRPIYRIGGPVSDGQPRHPLMPGYNTPVVPWETGWDLV